jgi:hypothetical protein
MMATDLAVWGLNLFVVGLEESRSHWGECVAFAGVLGAVHSWESRIAQRVVGESWWVLLHRVLVVFWRLGCGCLEQKKIGDSELLPLEGKAVFGASGVRGILPSAWFWPTMVGMRNSSCWIWLLKEVSTVRGCA